MWRAYGMEENPELPLCRRWRLCSKEESDPFRPGCIGGGRGSTVIYVCVGLGFPGSSDSEESDFNVKDLGSIPELARFPGEGNGSSLQYSCLFNKWKIPHTGSPDPIDNRAQKGGSVRWWRSKLCVCGTQVSGPFPRLPHLDYCTHMSPSSRELTFAITYLSGRALL